MNTDATPSFAVPPCPEMLWRLVATLTLVERCRKPGAGQVGAFEIGQFQVGLA